MKDILSNIADYLLIKEEFYYSTINKSYYRDLHYRLEKYKILLSIFDYLEIKVQIRLAHLNKRFYSLMDKR